MKTEKEKICTFCSKLDEEPSFEDLDGNLVKMLELLSIKVEYVNIEQPMVCKECVRRIKEAFNFKSNCVRTEERLSPYIKSETGGSVNLRMIYLEERRQEDGDDSEKICRLCMEPIKYGSWTFLADILENVRFDEVFGKYIPEVTLNVTKNPIVCDQCLECLQNFSNFLASFSDNMGRNKTYYKNESKGRLLEDIRIREFIQSDGEKEDFKTRNYNNPEECDSKLKLDGYSDRASFWKKNLKTVPGRPSPKRDVKEANKKKSRGTTSFQDFQASVSDAWDMDDDEFCIISGIDNAKISKKVSQSAALNVLNTHRSSTESERSKAIIPVTDIIRTARIPGRPKQLYCLNPPQEEDTERKLKRFEFLFENSPSLQELSKLSWSGVPVKVRGITWRLISGYLPINLERRSGALERKRQDYWTLVDQFYYTEYDETNRDIHHQIKIDVPRMNPSIALFQQKTVQSMFERILFIWSIRHPASGYVQGINDLVTPFYVVFLQEFIPEDRPFETFDIVKLTQDQLKIIEADSFWCLSKFLDAIQDNYVFAQIGIQKKVLQLEELIKRVDEVLHKHLKQHNVGYLQFSFRWLNNLLTRELPLRCTIRLWDTYLAENECFATFQLYVCAAFLLHWKKDLMLEHDFQGLLSLLQNLPTQSWTSSQISMLVAEAYKLKVMFADAPNHLLSNTGDS